MDKLERSTSGLEFTDITQGEIASLSESNTSRLDANMVTGRFQHDVPNICQAMGVTFVPRVVLRSPQGKIVTFADPVIPTEKVNEENKECEKSSRKKGRTRKRKKSSAKVNSLSVSVSSTMCQNRASSSMTSVVESRQGQAGDMLDYFYPSIQVVLEDADDDRSANTIRIRGWQLDEDLWYVMRLCWPALERFSTLHLWRTGLDSEALTVLCSILPLCRQLTTVVLDNNNLDTGALSGLLAPNSILQHLSLCFCSITDSSVVHLAEALGSPTSVNASLLTLRLTGNQIGDQGAGALADALKLNNSLLVLTLTGNCIGNQGAQFLAQALSCFPLSDEWSQIRKEMAWASFAKNQENWRLAKRNEFIKTLNLKVKKEKSRKEDASHDSSQMEMQLLSVKFSGTDWVNFLLNGQSGHQLKRPTKDLSVPQVDFKVARRSNNQGAKLDAMTKVKRKSKIEEIKVKENDTTQEDPKNPAAPSIPKPTGFQSGDLAVPALGAHPLLQAAILRGNYIWLPGNRSLISLNLSRNQVGEAGATALLTSMQLQEKDDKGRLLRLELHKNPVSPDCPAIMRLKALMNKRDPLNKVIVEKESLEQSSQEQSSSDEVGVDQSGDKRLKTPDKRRERSPRRKSLRKEKEKEEKQKVLDNENDKKQKSPEKEYDKDEKPKNKKKWSYSEERQKLSPKSKKEE